MKERKREGRGCFLLGWLGGGSCCWCGGGGVGVGGGGRWQRHQKRCRWRKKRLENLPLVPLFRRTPSVSSSPGFLASKILFWGRKRHVSPLVAATMAAMMALVLPMAVTTPANSTIECVGGDVGIGVRCLWLVVAWGVLGGSEMTPSFFFFFFFFFQKMALVPTAAKMALMPLKFLFFVVN